MLWKCLINFKVLCKFKALMHWGNGRLGAWLRTEQSGFPTKGQTQGRVKTLANKNFLGDLCDMAYICGFCCLLAFLFFFFKIVASMSGHRRVFHPWACYPVLLPFGNMPILFCCESLTINSSLLKCEHFVPFIFLLATLCIFLSFYK